MYTEFSQNAGKAGGKRLTQAGDRISWGVNSDGDEAAKAVVADEVVAGKRWRRWEGAKDIGDIAKVAGSISRQWQG